MSDQDRYIPGVPCWVDTTQPDPEAAAAFYGGLFGWELEDAMPPGGAAAVLRRPARRRGRRRDQLAAGGRRRRPPGTPTCGWTTPTRPPPRCAPPAATSSCEPFDVPGAGRMAVFADPAGAAFRVWQAREHRGADGRQRARLAELQRPQHPRPRTARAAFYGAVFGWEVLDTAAASMWALPGYGDFLEQRTPGTRENMAADGRSGALRGRGRERRRDRDDRPTPPRTGA